MGEQINHFYINGEYIDPISGEVLDVQTDYYGYAVSYGNEKAEKRRLHEVFVEPSQKKLFATVWRIGKSLGAPDQLIREVFYFLLKAKQLKSSLRNELANKPVYVTSEKYIKAVFLVFAQRYGLDSLARKIMLMPCNENGDPCYASRKRGDPEFRKYLRAVNYFASQIYQSNHKDPLIILDRLKSKYPHLLDEKIVARARDYISLLRANFSGKKAQTIVATAVVLATMEVSPENANSMLKVVCDALRVSDSSVKLTIKSLNRIGER